MATDPKRRQKALAKKAAKRRAKRAATRAASSGGSIGIARPSRFPIHECLAPVDLFERGIGNVLMSRQLPDGDVVYGGFLVDPWCLGVKNALLRACSEARYKDFVEGIKPVMAADEAEGQIANLNRRQPFYNQYWVRCSDRECQPA